MLFFHHLTSIGAMPSWNHLVGAGMSAVDPSNAVIGVVGVVWVLLLFAALGLGCVVMSIMLMAPKTSIHLWRVAIVCNMVCTLSGDGVTGNEGWC